MLALSWRPFRSPACSGTPKHRSPVLGLLALIIFLRFKGRPESVHRLTADPVTPCSRSTECPLSFLTPWRMIVAASYLNPISFGCTGVSFCLPRSLHLLPSPPALCLPNNHQQPRQHFLCIPPRPLLALRRIPFWTGRRFNSGCSTPSHLQAPGSIRKCLSKLPSLYRSTGTS